MFQATRRLIGIEEELGRDCFAEAAELDAVEDSFYKHASTGEPVHGPTVELVYDALLTAARDDGARNVFDHAVQNAILGDVSPSEVFISMIELAHTASMHVVDEATS